MNGVCIRLEAKELITLLSFTKAEKENSLLSTLSKELNTILPEEVFHILQDQLTLNDRGFHLADWLSISFTTAFLRYRGKKEQHEIALQLQGDLQLGETATFDGLLQLSLGTQENTLLIRSGDQGADHLSLPDLLTGAGKLVGMDLPHVSGDSTLSDFECGLSLTKKQLTFSGEVLLSINKHLKATFSVYLSYQAGQSLALHGKGKLVLDTVDFVANTGYDEGQGWWFTLQNQQPVNLGTLLDHLIQSDWDLPIPHELKNDIQLSTVQLALLPEAPFLLLEGVGKVNLALFSWQLELELILNVRYGTAPAHWELTSVNQAVQASSSLTLGDDLSLDLLGSYQKGQGWSLQGALNPGDKIPFDLLMKDLMGKFGIEIPTPGFLSVFEVSDLLISLDTGKSQYDFQGKVSLQHGLTVSFELRISESGSGSLQHVFKAGLMFDELSLDIAFVPGTSLMLASYQPENGRALSLNTLIKDLSGLQVPFPKLKLSKLHVGYDFGSSPHKLLLMGELGVGIGLSGLPLIGEISKEIQHIHLSADLRWATQAFSKKQIGELQQLLTDDKSVLPDAQVPKGTQLKAWMYLPNHAYPLDLPIGSPNPTSASQGQSTVTSGESGIHWFSIQKHLGPVDLQQIGLRYRGNRLTVAVDASFQLSKFVISFLGLSVTSPLTHLQPTFNLMGLGLGYKTNTYQVGGTLLRVEQALPHGDKQTIYDGQAYFKAGDLSFQGLGSYATVKGHPSLFAYAMLNKPLGGPPYFYVTGLSLGLGYNRSVKVPALQNVTSFPLVTYAIHGNQQTELPEVLQSLQHYLPPAEGKMFLVAGMTASTFGLIETVLLLIGRFGQGMEWDLLGNSMLSLPPKSPMVLAYADLPIKGTYHPEQGEVRIRGILSSDSFVLSRAVNLTGGFAFKAWDQGKFAFTLGGYDPRFRIPQGYPSVPRLRMSWGLNSHMGINGSLYMAVCGHIMMAGGHLEAAYHKGDFKASFDAAAHFLINWKPFHYEGKMHVDIGVSFSIDVLVGTVHISADVGADLELWGPEFGGHAKVHVAHHTFKIDFGANKPDPPGPIQWEEFSNSFLPKGNLIHTNIKAGLTSEAAVPNVNPKELILFMGFAIPLKSIDNISVNDEPHEKDINHEKDIKTIADEKPAEDEKPIEDEVSSDHIGIAPMAIRPKDLISDLTYMVVNTDENDENYTKAFEVKPVFKHVPAAIWGPKFNLQLNDSSFVKNACVGIELRPKNPTQFGHSVDIKLDQTQYELTTLPSLSWTPYGTKSKDNAKFRPSNQILKPLGIEEEISIDETYLDSLLTPPQKVELTS